MMAARVALVVAVGVAVAVAAPARPRGRYEVHADGYDLYCVGCVPLILRQLRNPDAAALIGGMGARGLQRVR